MEDRKTTLDRGQLSSEYIQGKQDFNHVLKVHRAMKPPLWKTAWFYGPVGLAIVAITISAVKFNPQQTTNTVYGETTTLEQTYVPTPPTETILAVAPFIDEDEVGSPQEKKETLKSPVKSAPIKKQQNRETAVPEVNEPAQQEVLVPKVILTVPEISTNDRPKAIKKTTNRNVMPTIDGVFTGNITAAQLCNSEGIFINDEWRVTQFTTQYNNGVEEIIQKINGASIPESICWKIHKFNLNIPVFITEIVAVDQAGARKSVPSMSLTPVY